MAAAIETFFEQASENQVALIIMDYKMPGMTGTELIKQVKRFLGG
jgi:CheY-like chemotaxis protein